MVSSVPLSLATPVKGSPYIREWIQMEQTVNSGQQEDDPESKDGE